MSFINWIKSIGKSVTYYNCPKCERVYMVRTSHCDYSSAGDLEGVLSAHKESDCRRNEEACGRCAENERHTCETDNARPLGSSNFFRNHSIRLARFIGLANSADSEAA